MSSTTIIFWHLKWAFELAPNCKVAMKAWHRKVFCNSQIRFYRAKVCSITYNWQPDIPQFNSLWNCARRKLWLYNLDMLNEFHLHNMDKSATAIPLIGQWQTETLTLKWTDLLLRASALICGVFPEGHDDLCVCQVGCTLGSDLWHSCSSSFAYH